MGIQVQKREKGYFVSQRAYVDKNLKLSGMSACNPVKTPAEKLEENNIEKSSLDMSIPYRPAVGSLMYQACATRPDIASVVSKAARSMTALTRLHWICVKQIFNICPVKNEWPDSSRKSG